MPLETDMNHDATLAAQSGEIARPDSKSRRSARRPLWEIAFEHVLEWTIRLCGISAIIFVFAIF